MPELPEVETIRIQLSDLIVGLKIADIQILHPKSFIGDKKLALQRKINGVRRFGKMLVIDLAGDYSLAVHLKMTGQLLLKSKIPASPAGRQNPNSKQTVKSEIPKINKHTRIIIIFTNGERLFFNDIRKFGWIKIVKNPNSKIPASPAGRQMSKKYQIPNFKYNLPTLQSITDRLGPEPLRDLTLGKFREILKSAKKPVKLILMDQEKIAGVGNIYANDALFLAKVHPKTSSMSISRDKTKLLYHNLLQVLKEGLKRKGASKTNFVDVFGQKGSMQEHFYVYGREGEMCANKCGGKIIRMTLGGRGTFFCRKCQSLRSNNLLDK